jgi:hypothetical protein
MQGHPRVLPYQALVPVKAPDRPLGILNEDVLELMREQGLLEEGAEKSPETEIWG